jgi:hypothetical protein
MTLWRWVRVTVWGAHFGLAAALPLSAHTQPRYQRTCQSKGDWGVFWLWPGLPHALRVAVDAHDDLPVAEARRLNAHVSQTRIKVLRHTNKQEKVWRAKSLRERHTTQANKSQALQRSARHEPGC